MRQHSLFFLLVLRHTMWQGLECRTVICSVQLGVGRKGRGSVCATQFPFCHWWSLNISSCRLPPVLLHKCWANSTALLKDYWYFKVCLRSYTTYSICRFLLEESLKDQVFSARISVWCLSSVDRLHSIILAEREREREDTHNVWYRSSEGTWRSSTQAEQQLEDIVV